MEELKIIRDKKTNIYTKANETIIFDGNGNIIKSHPNGHNNRPLIVFEINKKTYYLKVRSAKGADKRLPFEIEITKDDDLNNKLDKNSWVDTANIQIMDSDKFHKIYREKQFYTLNDLKSEKQLEIISNIFLNINNQKATIQEIDFDNDLKAYSKMIKQRNTYKINDEKAYELYKNTLLYNLGKYILKNSGENDMFKDYKENNNVYEVGELYDIIDNDIKQNGIRTQYGKLIPQFKVIISEDITKYPLPLLKINDDMTSLEFVNIDEFTFIVLNNISKEKEISKTDELLNNDTLIEDGETLNNDEEIIEDNDGVIK
ncbi:Mbov_0400 family ICE element protein, partial [Mycoplasma sp. 31_09]|uniref:Mbov_0400 family ICE element protein n=1 Tax=Mycoplasma sp. 31_09 TaxID=3401663 RepID=UPI003AAE2FEC